MPREANGDRNGTPDPPTGSDARLVVAFMRAAFGAGRLPPDKEAQLRTVVRRELEHWYECGRLSVELERTEGLNARLEELP